MKYTNTELEEKANSLLNNVLLEVFAKNNKIIGKHPSKLSHEIGIDYFYEIRDRTTGESLNVVFNQNKGTEKRSGKNYYSNQDSNRPFEYLHLLIREL